MKQDNKNPLLFKAGQIVQLKSGGPRMTVCAHGVGLKVMVTWFNYDEIQNYSFDPEVLKLVK
jgi:uncharacterized protein YodC (DUF2158 family)